VDIHHRPYPFNVGGTDTLPSAWLAWGILLHDVHVQDLLCSRLFLGGPALENQGKVWVVVASGQAASFRLAQMPFRLLPQIVRTILQAV
jgi:hypothetical protein